jgi:hypothetical protein
MVVHCDPGPYRGTNHSVFTQVVAAFGSEWPGSEFKPGAQFAGEQLGALRVAIGRTPLGLVNVDDEDVNGALLSLVERARASGGKVFVQ